MNELNWYGVEVQKRIHSLVIPFVTWLIVATFTPSFLLFAAEFITGRSFESTHILADNHLLETFGLDLRKVPHRLGVLWYVRCLFLFVLFSPIFKWLVLKGKVLWLSASFVLSFVHCSWTVFPLDLQQFFSSGFSLSGVFYFSVGIYIGLAKGKYVGKSKHSFALSSFIGASLLLVNGMFVLLRINPHFSLIAIAIPFMMYSIWWVIPVAKWPMALTACAFPIYILHQLFLTMFYHFIRYTSLGGSQLGHILVFLSAVIGSVCLAIILRTFFPRVNAFLFAGRN